MSETNRTRISIVRESTFGTTPASPAMLEIPFNSSSLTSSPNTTVSEEIRSDRQTADLFLVGEESSGDISGELQGLAYDKLIEGAFYNSITKSEEVENETVGGSVTIDSSAVDGSVVVSSGGDNFAADDIVRLSGFSNNENNQQFVVTSSTTTNIDGASGTVTEASSPVGARVKKVGVKGAAGDIVAATGPNSLTSTSLDFTTLGLTEGMWLKLGGSASANQFDTAANNDFVRILSISANQLTFDIVPTGWSADTASGKEIYIFIPDYVRNGTTQFSHSIEQSYLDIGRHQKFTGMVVGSMSLSMDSQSIIGTTFTFTGKRGEYDTSGFSGATYFRRQSRTALNTSSNVGKFAEGGTEISGTNLVTSASVDITNNLRARTAVGSLGATSIGAGTSDITGSLSTYFDTEDLLNKVISNTDTSMQFSLKDNGGAVTFLDLPRMKFSSGSTSISGRNDDVMAELEFQALADPVLGFQAQMLFFDSVE